MQKRLRMLQSIDVQDHRQQTEYHRPVENSNRAEESNSSDEGEKEYQRRHSRFTLHKIWAEEIVNGADSPGTPDEYKNCIPDFTGDKHVAGYRHPHQGGAHYGNKRGDTEHNPPEEGGNADYLKSDRGHHCLDSSGQQHA